MMRQFLDRSLILMVLLSPILSSCGSKDKSDSNPAVVYGKITVKSVSGTDSGSFELNSLTQCQRNVDTGRVDIVMSQGAGKPGLTLAIKDYSASAKTYTCVQALDNQSSTTSVGGKFESCMVGVTVPSTPTSTTAATLNGYSMYRESTAVKPFNYSGSCSIQVTEASPSIKATVSCASMVQTLLEGATRNPIDVSVTADLTGEFNCTFQ